MTGTTYPFLCELCRPPRGKQGVKAGHAKLPRLRRSLRTTQVDISKAYTKRCASDMPPAFPTSVYPTKTAYEPRLNSQATSSLSPQSSEAASPLAETTVTQDDGDHWVIGKTAIASEDARQRVKTWNPIPVSAISDSFEN
ncbi:hypothetical protein LIA77_06606 [Sarocladium implicatum]|nr:hypothetical protein LIA77_06606 [Sarocladium implicatum]